MTRHTDGTERDMAAIEELARADWEKKKGTAFSSETVIGGMKFEVSDYIPPNVAYWVLGNKVVGKTISDDVLDKAIALQEARYEAERLK